MSILLIAGVVFALLQAIELSSAKCAAVYSAGADLLGSSSLGVVENEPLWPLNVCVDDTWRENLGQKSSFSYCAGETLMYKSWASSDCSGTAISDEVWVWADAPFGLNMQELPDCNGFGYHNNCLFPVDCQVEQVCEVATVNVHHQTNQDINGNLTEILFIVNQCFPERRRYDEWAKWTCDDDGIYFANYDDSECSMIKEADSQSEDEFFTGSFDGYLTRAGKLHYFGDDIYTVQCPDSFSPTPSPTPSPIPSPRPTPSPTPSPTQWPINCKTTEVCTVATVKKSVVEWSDEWSDDAEWSGCDATDFELETYVINVCAPHQHTDSKDSSDEFFDAVPDHSGSAWMVTCDKNTVTINFFTKSYDSEHQLVCRGDPVSSSLIAANSASECVEIDCPSSAYLYAPRVLVIACQVMIFISFAA